MNLNEKQLVIALRQASKHPLVRKYFKSAGFIDNRDHAVNKAVVDNIKKLVVTTRETEKVKGRVSDNQRAIVHSLVMGCAPTPPQPQVDGQGE